MADYIATDKSLFFSKNDPRDPRLGDLVKVTGEGAKHDADVIVVGYPDDEGIRLNGGRVGAALGPTEIRHWLYRTTPHPRRPIKTFADGGNLNAKGSAVERHEKALAFTKAQLKAGV